MGCKNNEKRQKSVHLFIHSRIMHLLSIYVSGVHFYDKIIKFNSAVTTYFIALIKLHSFAHLFWR